MINQEFRKMCACAICDFNPFNNVTITIFNFKESAYPCKYINQSPQAATVSIDLFKKFTLFSSWNLIFKKLVRQKFNRCCCRNYYFRSFLLVASQPRELSSLFFNAEFKTKSCRRKKCGKKCFFLCRCLFCIKSKNPVFISDPSKPASLLLNFDSTDRLKKRWLRVFSVKIIF